METTQNRIYKGILVGIAIRGQIGHDRIFRVRHGNGHYDSILGALYQDQYAYVVPSSTNNPEGQSARNALSAGIIAWQALTAAAKKALDKKASIRGLRMSGYNLFMRDYIKANA